MCDQRTLGAEAKKTDSIGLGTWIALLSGEITPQQMRQRDAHVETGIVTPSREAPAGSSRLRKIGGADGNDFIADAVAKVIPDPPMDSGRVSRVPLHAASNKRVRRRAERFQAVCDAYGNVCLRCGKSKRLTIDHVIPKSKGGSNHATNWQPLCQRCNSKKGVDSTDYRIPVPEHSTAFLTR